MLAIRLTPDIEERLNRLTQETGRSKTALAREAILEHLDDLEDFYLAEARARQNRKSIPLIDVERELGLAD
jgi:RHH-type rel operon transcriptional repressor/antitoxin RelB